MRTIRSLTERDGPMWRTHCPMLDGLARALPELLHSAGVEVSAEPIALTPADLALAAFELFTRWATASSDLDTASARRLMESEGLASGATHADDHDSSLIAAVASNMAELGVVLGKRTRARTRVELTPCGVLESAHCDCVWGEDLIEFKAVRRSFGVRDLRQAILYGALARLSEPGFPDALILANPIGATFVRLPVDELANVISAEPFDALTQDLADYLVGLGVSG